MENSEFSHFKLGGNEIVIFDGGAKVKFRDGSVKEYDNPKEAVCRFTDDFYHEINKIIDTPLRSAIEKYGYNWYSGEKIDKIKLRAMYNEDMTVSEIAAEMGVKFSDVEKALESIGCMPVYDIESSEPCQYVREK